MIVYSVNPEVIHFCYLDVTIHSSAGENVKNSKF